ncbi:hypothetical protein TWF694_002603 [Orbilia ellipsospora]|uniref:Peptidase C14 caspase domain-containing protein n=1 Tax=Orbilia ellipsospora TaxID=2528407 RepID=A0AAV9X2K6_9PEZI
MNESQSTAAWTRWAVLIGVGMNVDATQDDLVDFSVKGAVADIEAAEAYLKTENDIKITKLTVEKSNETGRASSSVNGLPTIDNVRVILKNIIDKCSNGNGEGKQIYIHFSGHGTQLEDDMALVLYDPGPCGETYLRSAELACALNGMIQQKMQVTVVLDCCFSGGVQRTGQLRATTVRFKETTRNYDSHANYTNPFAEFDLNETLDGTRDGTLQLEHFLDTKKYTTITACSPYDTASEIELAGGKRRGALSYFLYQALDMLGKRGTKITYSTLYHQLQSRFHAHFPQQSPMIYGNTELCFFQNVVGGLGTHLVTVSYGKESEKLILHAGDAHGVCENDEYEAYPYYASEVLGSSKPRPLKLRVTKTENLISELLIPDTSQQKLFRMIPNWKAKPLTSFYPKIIRISLMPSVCDSDQNQLSENLHSHRFLKISKDATSPVRGDFIVTMNENAYEVRDGASRIVPGMIVRTRVDFDALGSLGNMLGHLATFKVLESMENRRPDAGFHESFSLKATQGLGLDGWFNLRGGEKWKFTITNLGDNPIYVAIFNFTYNWEIRNLIKGKGMHLVIPGKGHKDSYRERSITMNVPPGKQETEDIMKFFITNRPTSFSHMKLSPMMSPEAGNNSEQRDNDLVSELLEDFIEEFGNIRQGSEGHWATQSFLIRTQE